MTTDLVLFSQPVPSSEFLKLYNRLCVAFRELPDEHGVAQDVYFAALSDLPLLALARAVEMMVRDSTQKFFPKVTEWREHAELAYRKELSAAVKPTRDKPWLTECSDCDDTGWILMDCGIQRCDRHYEHSRHEYVIACPCRATNRTYHRHHVFGRAAND